MAPQQQAPLEVCQRVQTTLREVERLVPEPGNQMLAQCETELGQAAALLESMREFVTEGRLTTDLRGDTTFQQALQEIQRTAGRLKAQFEHGSNYCMGLLQTRLGAGYSELGRPVLLPTEAKGSFEG